MRRHSLEARSKSRGGSEAARRYVPSKWGVVQRTHALKRRGVRLRFTGKALSISAISEIVRVEFCAGVSQLPIRRRTPRLQESSVPATKYLPSRSTTNE